MHKSSSKSTYINRKQWLISVIFLGTSSDLVKGHSWLHHAPLQKHHCSGKTQVAQHSPHHWTKMQQQVIFFFFCKSIHTFNVYLTIFRLLSLYTPSGNKMQAVSCYHMTAVSAELKRNCFHTYRDYNQRTLWMSPSGSNHISHMSFITSW